MTALEPDTPVGRFALTGRRVALEPLAEAHLPGIADAIRDGELWKLPVTLVPHPDDLPAFLRQALERGESNLELAFATRDLASGSLAGSTRFMKIDRRHRRVEIGFTFIGQSWQRTHVNTEAKFLMLRHAFETWRCIRVELLTDVLNTRSRNAIARIGAREEGVLRSHMIMRDGRVRDSALYAITEADWPSVKRRLTERFSSSAS
jgi:RimJ/RimL family protein N-acetyltransferase